MALTMVLQQDMERAVFLFTLAGISLVWIVINYVVVRKVDPELSFEVARLLIPSGVLLSISLSIYLSTVLDAMVPVVDGRQHWVLFFVGLGVSVFLGVRALDMKWLRAEEEISSLENLGRK
jgi:hypothetical protein